ncbi:MAG TPA: hypothetical protein P5509_04110, partial [Bacteroidales bacterium]|nr:hypothetical protein [Bacteroidales bacterium]
MIGIKKYFLHTLLSFIIPVIGLAQNTNTRRFIEPEIQLGKIVKTNSFFPKRTLQQRYRINFGRIHYGDEKSWESFYSYPISGISLSFNVLGNDTVFGKS